MGNPKISVIVPVYKVENYIDRCIDSIVNQTFEDIEIILVDDKSPDGSPQKCDEWAKRDSRIKVIHKSTNEGLGFARNTGLQNATGEYVTFIDSDDWIDLNMYADLYALCQQHNADIVYSGLKRIDDSGNISFLPHPKEQSIYQGSDVQTVLLPNIIASEPHIKEDRLIQVSVDTCLFRKSIIDSWNIRFHSEREIISEDLFFHIDYLPHVCSAIVSPKHYYFYYYNEQSLSSVVRTDRFEKYKVLHAELTKKSTSAQMQQRIDRILIGYTRSYLKRIIDYPIPNKSKFQMFSTICNDSIWDSVSARYPVNDMFFIHKLVYRLISKKRSRVLFILLNILCKLR